MADAVPPGAFDACAQLETAAITKPTGGMSPAFASRANSLRKMRTVVNQLDSDMMDAEERLSKLEEMLRSRPF